MSKFTLITNKLPNGDIDFRVIDKKTGQAQIPIKDYFFKFNPDIEVIEEIGKIAYYSNYKKTESRLSNIIQADNFQAFEQLITHKMTVEKQIKNLRLHRIVKKFTIKKKKKKIPLTKEEMKSLANSLNLTLDVIKDAIDFITDTILDVEDVDKYASAYVLHIMAMRQLKASNMYQEFITKHPNQKLEHNILNQQHAEYEQIKQYQLTKKKK